MLGLVLLCEPQVKHPDVGARRAVANRSFADLHCLRVAAAQLRLLRAHHNYNMKHGTSEYSTPFTILYCIAMPSDEHSTHHKVQILEPELRVEAVGLERALEQVERTARRRRLVRYRPLHVRHVRIVAACTVHLFLHST